MHRTGPFSTRSSENTIAEGVLTLTNFADDPVAYFGNSGHAAQHIPPDEMQAIQLQSLRSRFSSLRHRLPVLKRMADEQDINRVDEINDVVTLLFPHTAYKSYPISLLEKSRFPQLTKWLSRLTIHDVSAVASEDFSSIDDWLTALDESTELRVAHSSGTTGILSLLPRSREELEMSFKIQHMNLFESIDPEGLKDHSKDYFDVVWGTFTSGRSAAIRSVEFFKRFVAGSPQRFHTSYEGHLSADVMFLAGRIRSAAARGETFDLEAVSPALKARRAAFVQLQQQLAQSIGRLTDDVLPKLEGKKVLLSLMQVPLYELAKRGVERGIKNALAPGSVVQTGGGRKGEILPDDWEDVVKRFTGVSRIDILYGMSEITMTCYRCNGGRFHISPWVIPFVLEPNTGAPLPRTGVQRGRAAFFDLVPRSYWGGFVTGDEIEIDWSRCSCGRTTPHIHSHIQRYTEKTGGDDKITCAAAEDAHKAAFDLLAGELR